MRSTIVSIFVVSFITLAACDGSRGDSCDDEGKVQGECDDGLVCGKQKLSGGSLICLKQCNSPTDCGAGEDCNNIANTDLRGCQAR
jgi:hypothetical protein